MTRLTKVSSLAASIIRQMPDVGRWQTKFLLHVFSLWLSIRGRYNFIHLSRYGELNEATYRRQFAKPFDWLDFNTRLAKQYLSQHRIIAFDPSYITKSGKYTDGVDYFWSGCSNDMKWGQELCGLAAVDLTDKTALHLVAIQTIKEEGRSLMDYYCSIIELNSDQLHQVSDYVVVDAYFAKVGFVNRMLKSEFHVITRLRCDQVLYYPYTGMKRHRRGAPKKYDGRVNPRNLDMDKFVPCAQAQDGKWMAFESIAYVKAWKRWCRVVVTQNFDKKGNIVGHTTIASTDQQLDGGTAKLSYQCRYQQEFLYRDAKQELGLEDGQAYSWQKVDYHFNMALTVGSLAKAAHHLVPKKPNDDPFSIADVKTQYVNESMAWRIIRGCGICPDSPIIRTLIPQIRKLGMRRA